jgi:hypothetical protein
MIEEMLGEKNFGSINNNVNIVHIERNLKKIKESNIRQRNRWKDEENLWRKKKRIKRPGGMNEKKKGCEKNLMKRKRNGWND